MLPWIILQSSGRRETTWSHWVLGREVNKGMTYRGRAEFQKTTKDGVVPWEPEEWAPLLPPVLEPTEWSCQRWPPDRSCGFPCDKRPSYNHLAGRELGVGGMPGSPSPPLHGLPLVPPWKSGSSRAYWCVRMGQRPRTRLKYKGVTRGSRRPRTGFPVQCRSSQQPSQEHSTLLVGQAPRASVASAAFIWLVGFRGEVQNPRGLSPLDEKDRGEEGMKRTEERKVPRRSRKPSLFPVLIHPGNC